MRAIIFDFDGVIMDSEPVHERSIRASMESVGLSMSHDIIVKQHGGTIDVDTVPGEFTEFTIALPRSKN